MTNPLSIDPVPILPTSFLELVDKRTVGKAVFFTEIYQISLPPPLPEEQPDPFVGEVRLRECPEHDSFFPIFISGYTEVSSTPSTGQFSVDYKNGVLSFPVAAIGTDISVSYYGLGSIIMAADVNNITSQLVPFFNKLNGGDDLGLLRRTTDIATSGQTVFSAGFPVTSSTMVYSQGLLMTEGGLADYIEGGPGIAGTSISDTALVSLSGGTLTINLNGDGPRTITLGTDTTGAEIAADIQVQMRGLTAITGGNQAAYNGFTAAYNGGTGLYTLTSGTIGTSSTVAVTGASDAALLELGLAYGGIETPGTAGAGSSYALLATSAITGSAAGTTINGDVDITPNTFTSVTGFPPSTMSGGAYPGVVHSNDSVAIAAMAAAQADFTTHWGSYPTPNNTGTLITGGILDGYTMDQSGATPGVYYASSTATLAGTSPLTFSAPGTYIIAVGSALNTGASGMQVMSFTGTATPSNTTIKWYVGSAATIDISVASSGGIFYGSVNAYAAITVTSGGIINGSLAATGPAGAITFSDGTSASTVNGPPAGTAGTSVSETASVPVTSISSGVLLVIVDGGLPQPITLATNVTGAAIAADIQAKVRALFPSNPSYSNFTATYNGGTGLYTLTSGVRGPNSSVSVMKVSRDIALKLGLSSGGTETPGTAGTSVSGASPATSIAGGTLTINLNGDGPRTITLAASGDTTGTLTAADIQFRIRALTATNPAKQAAYSNFTAVYTTVYTLTSGTVGVGSSIVVSSGTDRAALKLGTGLGTEVAGTSGTSISAVAPAGTSVSGASPATTATSLTFNVNINGDGSQSITIDDGGTHTGAAVAAALQTRIRALVANSPSNQAAINASTAVYTSVYTITSGTVGTGSAVVVTGSGASTLKLGLASGGTEASNSGSSVGDTLVINLNGDGFRIITLGTDTTGAAVAADIQAKVRALTSITPSFQTAYNNFIATYNSGTGLYTLTPGMTISSSSVVVAGTSPAIDLALGLTEGGAEMTGISSFNQVTFNVARYAGEIINFINVGI